MSWKKILLQEPVASSDTAATLTQKNNQKKKKKKKKKKCCPTVTVLRVFHAIKLHDIRVELSVVRFDLARIPIQKRGRKKKKKKKISFTRDYLLCIAHTRVFPAGKFEKEVFASDPPSDL
jgi:hypothetical protein